MSRGWLRHACVLALLLGLASALWVHRVHRSPRRPEGPIARIVTHDLRFYYVPYAAFARRELLAGSFPLWNPYQLAGEPVVGIHMPSLLYPPLLLVAWLWPAVPAMSVHAVLHLVLAGFGTWLFLGRLALGPAARLAGALTWMLSGHLLYLVYFPSFLATVAWLPLLLWIAHGLVHEGRARWAGALALAASLSLLGGYAQGWLYQLPLLAAYALFELARRARRGRPGWARALRLGALAGVATLGLCAVQLLPTFELLARGGRGLAPLGVSDEAPLPLRVLLRGLVGLRSEELWRLPTFRLSALALPLVLCGVAARRWRSEALFFGIAGGLSALLLLGRQTPLYALYQSVPVVGAFRDPQRFGFLYFWCIAVLTALGVQGLRAWLERRARPTAAPVSWLVLVALAVDLQARADLPFGYVGANATRAEGPAGRVVEELRRRSGLDRVYLEQPVWTEARILSGRLGLLEQLHVVPDYESLLPRAYHDYFRAKSPLWKGQLDLSGAFATLPLGSLVRLLDLMSVRFYALEAPFDPGLLPVLERRLGSQAEDLGPVRLLERRAALPRAYVVFQTEAARDEEGALARLVDPGFQPQRAALVLPGGPRLSGSDGRGAAEILHHAPQRVEIEARCNAPCLLVLTDLHYPGWRARVDGAPAPVHRANFLYRGVVLEPGSHRVVFDYRPVSVRLGAVLSLGTLAALLAAGVAARLLPKARALRARELRG